MEVVTFSIGIQRKDYNLFAPGPAGTGKQALVRRHVEARTATCLALLSGPRGMKNRDLFRVCLILRQQPAGNKVRPK